MAVDPVILRKSQIVEQYLRRIQEEFGAAASIVDLTLAAQDSVLLNLERACQASIDMSMRLTRIENLGVPLDARDSFEILFKKKILSQDEFKAMSSMVGFRNTAVHDYQGLNLKIVDSVVKNNLDDFRSFIAAALRR